jgi:hypothetical protein
MDCEAPLLLPFPFGVYGFGHCHPRHNIGENTTTATATITALCELISLPANKVCTLLQGSNEKADFVSMANTALFLLICMALALVVAG